MKQAPCKPLRSQDQDQDKEQDQELAVLLRKTGTRVSQRKQKLGKLMAENGLLKLPLPSRPCIYFLVEYGKIVYVGRTKCVWRRLAEHCKTKEFDEVYYLPVPEEMICVFEEELIRKIRPKYNTTHISTTSQSLPNIRGILKAVTSNIRYLVGLRQYP